MPTAQNLVPDLSRKKATGIYIARGSDTLGPYNPEEAAALIVGGYLHADDYAAHNGDTAWVPLADFLPPTAREPAVKTEPPRPATPSRWRRLAVVFSLLAAVPFLVAGGVRWIEERRVSGFAADPSPTPAAVSPAATPTPPPTPEPDGPLRGSLAVPLAGVQVALYPLDELEAALAPVATVVRLAREQLDPPVDAAVAEHAARAAEEQAALNTLTAADPADPLIRSLRFAHKEARTATRTAADNEHFLRDERAAAVGGEVFFRVLPAPAFTAETDAAGRFTLDLPADGRAYAVAASVPTTDDDGRARTRRWLVRLSPAQATGHSPVLLDDVNALTSASEDSVVHAVE